MNEKTRILYCHCAYARVIRDDVKQKVLEGLCEAGVAFDSVADLCEMSARSDPSLKGLACDGGVKIAACYPRAVKWLFSAAGAPLPADGVEILNMREEDPDRIVEALLAEAHERKEAS